MFEKDHGVIIACDVDDINTLRDLVRSTCDIEGIVGYKIGANLALKYGLKHLTDDIDFHLPIIYDHQKAGTDIPRMGETFARACKESGLSGVIIFPQAGPKSEDAFIDAILNNGLVPFVGGEMTHEQYLASDGGYIKDEAPARIYEIAARKHVNFFVVPGNKPEAIKQHHLLLISMINEPKYCMPGIGTQGGSITDAFMILRGYAAYAIIGSAIYKSHDMSRAAHAFAKEAMSFE